METIKQSQQLVNSKSKKKRLAVRLSTETEDDLMQSDSSSLNDSYSDGTLHESGYDFNQEDGQSPIENDDVNQSITLPPEIERNIIKWRLMEIFQGYVQPFLYSIKS